MSTENAGRNVKHGRADIVVVDDPGNPVRGALISGQFTGDIQEDVIEAQTNNNGSATVITSQAVKPLKNLTLCGTYIAHDTLDDF